MCLIIFSSSFNLKRQSSYIRVRSQRKLAKCPELMNYNFLASIFDFHQEIASMTLNLTKVVLFQETRF